MPYLALKPRKFGEKIYCVDDVIPDSVVDPKVVKRLESAGVIKAVPAAPAAPATVSGPTAVDTMLTMAQAIQPAPYTPESYKALADAVAETAKLASSKALTEEETVQHLTAIHGAIQTLVPAAPAAAATETPAAGSAGKGKDKGSTENNKAG